MRPKKTIVIAEVGCNWKNVEEAKRMIFLANEAGATHVKFQAYTTKDISESPKEIREHLKNIKLTPTKVAKLKEYADEIGIEFMATPTSLDRYIMLKKLGINTIKIREKDKGNTELCAPIFSDKKQMIVSTSIIPTLINLVNPNVKWMYCFTPDNLVVTYQGVKSIDEIKENDLVLTHKGRWRKVTNVFKRYYDGKILHLKTSGLLEIKCTPNHMLLGLRHKWTNHRNSSIKKNKMQPLEWIDAYNYVAGNRYSSKRIDYLSSPKINDIEKPIYDSPEFYNILGAFLSEGHIRIRNNRKEKRCGIAFSFRHDEPLEKETKQFMEQLFNVKPTHISNGKMACNLVYSRTKLGEMFSQFYDSPNYSAKTKMIPWNLLDSPYLSRTLRTYFMGDGSVDKHNYTVTTVSPTLAFQIHYALAKYGIWSNFKLTPSKLTYIKGYSKRFYIGKPSYTLSISGKDVKVLENLINLGETGSHRAHSVIDIGHSFLTPIRKIIEDNYTGTVYNLEVDEDESYVINGLAVHNCVPRYPPKLEEIMLEKFVPFLKGYSNHYPNIAVPLYAVFLGAEVIEVHMTLNRNRNDIDIKVSIDFDELKKLVDIICVFEKIRCTPNKDYALKNVDQ